MLHAVADKNLIKSVYFCANSVLLLQRACLSEPQMQAFSGF